jgi:hypothetical protein
MYQIHIPRVLSALAAPLACGGGVGEVVDPPEPVAAPPEDALATPTDEAHATAASTAAIRRAPRSNRRGPRCVRIRAPRRASLSTMSATVANNPALPYKLRCKSAANPAA